MVDLDSKNAVDSDSDSDSTVCDSGDGVSLREVRT